MRMYDLIEKKKQGRSLTEQELASLKGRFPITRWRPF